MSNFMSNFTTKIFTVNFLSTFEVVEIEFEFEPSDLVCGKSALLQSRSHSQSITMENISLTTLRKDFLG